MQRIPVSCSRRAALICLAFAVFNLQSTTVLGNSVVTSVPPAGELTIAGSVHVDGAPAISGQTFFPGSTFRVAPSSLSTLTLRNRGRLELSAETILQLDFSDEMVTGALTAGRLRVLAPAGVTIRLTTTDATVLANSRQPALFSVESGRDGPTKVSVEAGQVELSFGNRTQLVSAGEALSTAVGLEALMNARPHLGGAKRQVLLHSLVGVLSIITLILAGNGGGEVEELCFGGTVTFGSPSSMPVIPDPCR